MPSHIALLRGINVGGRNRVAMADLRDVVARLGHTDVSTYIQSGNVVFSTSPAGRSPNPTSLAESIERAIVDRLDVRCSVVVVPADELERVVQANPYSDEPNPKKVHVLFYREPPGDDVADAVAKAGKKVATKGSPDTACVVGAVTYLHTPDGFGRSDLAAALVRTPGATARNWATVLKLHALVRQPLPPR